MSKALDIAGKTFWRLTVIKRVENDRHGKTMWLCKCECGNELVSNGAHLKKGHSKSCGCLQKETIKYLATTHGKCKSPEYRAFKNMLLRCYDEKSKGYENYGMRGIAVADIWRYDFSQFYQDMGPKPSPQHSIERMDVDGNYEPGNCKWATNVEQSRNRRIKLTNKTGVTGVQFDRQKQKYISKITVDKKTLHLGGFT